MMIQRFGRFGGAARAGFAAGATLGLLALATCTPDQVIVPVRNLERPADLGFVCVQKLTPADGQGPAIVTGRPMRACHDPEPVDMSGTPEPARARAQHAIVAGDRQFGTYGLITNTARGEVAVVDFRVEDESRPRLVDLDPRTPGYNQVPVGSLPEAISVSGDGCRAVTANRGTCDLSVIDVSGLLARNFGAPAATADKGVPVAAALKVRTGEATLEAQPRELAFLPPAPGAGGEHCGSAAGGGPADLVVTYPHCGLVAIVRLPEGRITSSVRVLSDGSVVNAGTDPVCPVECGGGSARDAGAPPLPVDAAAAGTDAGAEVGGGDAGADAADAGADAAGAPVAPPPAPAPANPALPPADARALLGGLAVTPDGMRVYVGLAQAPQVIPLAITTDPATGARQISGDGGGRVTLAEGAAGVTRLRLSVDPFGPSLRGGFVGERGEFVYAFARDGSARVIDVSSPTLRECDVNVEPDLLRRETLRDEPCIPVSARRPRRLMAQGPGLRFPVNIAPDVAPPLAIDIAFTESEGFAIGYLLSSNGTVAHVYLGRGRVQVTDGSLPEPVDAAVAGFHNFRVSSRLGNSRAGGDPVVRGEPARNTSSTDVPFASKGTFVSGLDGPRLEAFAIPPEVRPSTWAHFPRPRELSPEDVSIEWQGPLPGAQRVNGRLELPTGAAGNAGALSDVGANFCRSGVQPGDIVALVRCEQDAECDLLRDEACHRAAPGAPGVCVPRAFLADEVRLRSCRSEYASRRRYEVSDDVRAQRLGLTVKLDEVPRPGITPCQIGDDEVCKPDPGHRRDPRIADDRDFSCMQVRGAPRCVKNCGVMRNGVLEPDDALCRPGHVCANVGEATPLCVEAPPPKLECLTGELRYRVHVGNGFRVHSSSIPELQTRREEADGRCAPIPGLDWRFANRIPLSAPACAVTPGERSTGEFITTTEPRAAGGPHSPCLFVGTNGDDPISGSQQTVKALFENPNVRFVLTNLDDYVGDVLSMQLQIDGGFAPLRVLATRAGADVVLGVRITSSPMAARKGSLSPASRSIPVPPYLFVIDQARTASELSRGQLLRINPRESGVNLPGGFFDSVNTDTFYPLQ